jgi:hypothetical protein
MNLLDSILGQALSRESQPPAAPVETAESQEAARLPGLLAAYEAAQPPRRDFWKEAMVSSVGGNVGKPESKNIWNPDVQYYMPRDTIARMAHRAMLMGVDPRVMIPIIMRENNAKNPGQVYEPVHAASVYNMFGNKGYYTPDDLYTYALSHMRSLMSKNPIEMAIRMYNGLGDDIRYMNDNDRIYGMKIREMKARGLKPSDLYLGKIQNTQGILSRDPTWQDLLENVRMGVRNEMHQ